MNFFGNNYINMINYNIMNPISYIQYIITICILLKLENAEGNPTQNDVVINYSKLNHTDIISIMKI